MCLEDQQVEVGENQEFIRPHPEFIFPLFHVDIVLEFNIVEHVEEELQEFN